jgi:hypothetical protein
MDINRLFPLVKQDGQKNVANPYILILAPNGAELPADHREGRTHPVFKFLVARKNLLSFFIEHFTRFRQRFELIFR